MFRTSLKNLRFSPAKTTADFLLPVALVAVLIIITTGVVDYPDVDIDDLSGSMFAGDVIESLLSNTTLLILLICGLLVMPCDKLIFSHHLESFIHNRMMCYIHPIHSPPS